MERSQSIQRQFAAAAERYAVSSYHRNSPCLPAMVASAELKGGERVLDVGTGTGHTALAFAARGARVTGVDLTEAMLEEARGLARAQGREDIRFERGDAMDLPYADASFDQVACRVCAHHFADPRLAAREMARVLRPGGRLLLVDSVAPEDPAQDTFLNCIELLRDPSHVRDYRVSEWMAMLSEAGLEPECLETWGVPLDFEEWVERMGTPPTALAQLRAMFEDATGAVRAALVLRCGPAWGFDIPIALLRARRPAGGVG